MGFFDKFRKNTAVDAEALRVNYISARQQNLSYVQRTRVQPGELNKLFTQTKKTTLEKVGDMDVPGERLIICDPCYLGSNMVSCMERAIQPGKYPVFAAVMNTKMTGRVISAVKVKVSDQLTVRHELAMPVGFKMWQAEDPGVFPGISMETNVGCVVDKVTELPIAAYLNRYYDTHPGQDLIHNELLPLVEKTGYAMWQIPGTEYTVPLFSSGLGSGIYNAFWGFDKDNRLTELVLPMVYPELFE